MRVRRGSAEAPQDQVVVRVVTCILDRHVMEQMTVCSQDIAGPVAHLPDALVHLPCLDALQPRLVMWEEVSLHALQSLLHHGRHNPLVLLPDLWRGQVGVEISDHQKRPP